MSRKKEIIQKKIKNIEIKIKRNEDKKIQLKDKLTLAESEMNKLMNQKKELIDSLKLEIISGKTVAEIENLVEKSNDDEKD